MSTNGSGGQAEVFGDLFERKVLVVSKTKDHFLLRRQPLDGSFDGDAKLTRHQLSLGIRSFIDGFDQHDLTAVAIVGAGEETDETAAAQRVARAIDGDARQPRLELRASFELRQVRV